MEIRIDPELQRLIPPLTTEEYSQLETNLLTDGCRDPLVVWKRNDETILLDGHNRLKICEAHGLDYAVVEETLPDIESAKNWMDANQLGRRNLTRELMSKIRGRRYNREKKTVPNPDGIGGKSGKIVKGKNCPQQTTAKKLATEYGVSERTIKNDGKFAEECDNDANLDMVVMTRGDVKAYKKKIKRAERIEQIKKQDETPKLPKRLYQVVYADPPWQYEHCKTDNRKIENQYPTMALDDICNLPVNDITTPVAILFLWATPPKLEEALQVMRAWDFKYRTCAVWVKDKIGMGYYFRQQHELLLVGVRGDMVTPSETDRVSSVINAPRGKHSAKPESVYEIITRMYPDLSKIELFARNKRDGFDSWGSQA